MGTEITAAKSRFVPVPDIFAALLEALRWKTLFRQQLVCHADTKVGSNKGGGDCREALEFEKRLKLKLRLRTCSVSGMEIRIRRWGESSVVSKN